MFKRGARFLFVSLMVLGIWAGIGVAAANAAVTVSQYDQMGRDALANHDIVAADKDFQAALLAAPTDPTANFFRAITRLLVIVQNPGTEDHALDNLQDFLDGFGISGDPNVYNMVSHVPSGMSSPKTTNQYVFNNTTTFWTHKQIPQGAPTGANVQSYLMNTVVPAINASIANITALPSTFTIVLSPQETDARDYVLIDMGDMQLFKSTLQLVKAAMEFEYVYNVDLDPYDLYTKKVNRFLATGRHYTSDKNDILGDTTQTNPDTSPYPYFLTPVSGHASYLTSAKTDLLASITTYQAASAFIRARTASYMRHMVSLDGKMADREASIRALLTNSIVPSINGTGTYMLPPGHGGGSDRHINLSKAFNPAAPINIRLILPTDLNPVTNKRMVDPVTKAHTTTFPDASMGGLLDGNGLQIDNSGGNVYDGFIVGTGQSQQLVFEVKDNSDGPNYGHVSGATVVASFSNGESPLPPLTEDYAGGPYGGPGHYYGTWSPSHVGACKITVTATVSGSLQMGSSTVSGYPYAAHNYMTGAVVTPTTPAAATDGHTGSMDSCSSPATFSTLPYNSMVRIDGLTWQDTNDPQMCDAGGCAPLVYTVWYKYTPTTSGNIVITAQNSWNNWNMAPFLAVATSQCDSNINDYQWTQTGYGFDSTYYTYVTAGQPIYILIGQPNPYSPSDFGPGPLYYTLHVEALPSQGGSADWTPPPFQQPKCASVNSSGQPASGDNYGGKAISLNGVIPFVSDSTDAPMNVTNYVENVFVRDTVNNVTQRVTPATGTDGQPINQPSGMWGVDISDDGNLVVFDSNASNLLSGVDGTHDNIFVYNRATNTTTCLTSQGYGPAMPANGDSTQVLISGNGRYVLFASYASNFIASPALNGQQYVFISDLANINPATGQPVISLVSQDGSGNPLSNCVPFAIAPDGGYAIFRWLGAADVYYRYTPTHDSNGNITGGSTSNLLSWNDIQGDPALKQVSDDGRFTVYGADYSMNNIYPGSLHIKDNFTGRDITLPIDTSRVIIMPQYGGVQDGSMGAVLLGWIDPVSGYPTTGVFYLPNPLYTALPRVKKNVSPPGTGWVVLSPQGPKGVYAKGTSVTATAVPAPGYAFTGWGGVSATWNAYHTKTGGTTPDPVGVQQGPAVLSFTQNSDGSFSGTLNGGGKLKYVTGTISGQNITWSFTDGDGLGTTTATGTVNAAWTSMSGQYTDIEFTGATIETGTWTAAYSSGGLTGTTNPATITVNSNMTVTANFAPTKITSAILTASPATHQNAGGPVTFTAAAAGGFGNYQYSFVWVGPTPPGSPLSVAGNWSLYGTPTGGTEKGPDALSLTQTGSTLSGTDTDTIDNGNPKMVFGTITTTTTGQSITFSWTNTDGDTIALTGTVNTNGATMSGTYTKKNTGGTTIESGTWRALNNGYYTSSWQTSNIFSWSPQANNLGINGVYVRVKDTAATGGWSVYSTSDGGTQQGPFAVTLTQNLDGSISGSVGDAPDRKMSSGTITGSITGNTVNLTVVGMSDCGTNTSTMTGTLSADGSSISGTFSSVNSCGTTTGTWTATNSFPAASTMTSAPITYQITNPVSVASLTPSVNGVTNLGPVGTGVAVRWTAAAAGGIGTYQYQFSRMGPGTGVDGYKVMQVWGASNAYTWTTAAGDVGASVVKVEVRNSDGTDGASQLSSPYTVSSAMTISAPAPSPTGSVAWGTPVTWSASVKGGSGNYEYRFEVAQMTNSTPPTASSTYNIVQDWNSSYAYTSQNPVSYVSSTTNYNYMRVWARNAGDTNSADWLASQFAAFTVTAPPISTSLAVSPADHFTIPQPGSLGTYSITAVTLTGNARGGYGSYNYAFAVTGPITATSSGATTTSNGTNNTCTWVPATSGNYSMSVTVTDLSNPAATKPTVVAAPYTSGAPYKVTTPLTLSFSAPGTSATSVSAASAPRSGPVNTVVSFTVWASGGSGSYKYQFLRIGPDTKGSAKVMSDWGSSNYFTWTPAPETVGSNTLLVRVKNSDSTGRLASVQTTFTVTSTVPVATLSATGPDSKPSSHIEQGQPVTWTATAYGGDSSGQYQFQFLLDNVVKQSWSNAWSSGWTTKASTPVEEYGAVACAMNGKLYVAGGTNGGALYAYDPVLDSWSNTGAYMPKQIWYASGGVINGTLYVAGGFDGATGNTVDTLYAYDGTSWSQKASMPGLKYYTSAAVINGKLYVVGDRSLYIYDPAMNSWTTGAAIPNWHSFGPAVAAIGGKLYVAGGDTFNGSFDSPTTSLDVYDPALDTWTTKASMLVAQSDATAAVINGRLYAIGGLNADYLNVVEAYDPAMDKWTTTGVPTMPTARYLLSGDSINGTFYAVGGENNSGYLSTVEAFSVVTSSTGTWTMSTGSLTGTHSVAVQVANSGSGTPPPSTAYTTSKPVSYKIDAPITVSALTPSLAGPQIASTAITFTASATGGDGSGLQYQFQVDSVVKQDWSVANTWKWTTGQADIGGHTVTVYVRNKDLTGNWPHRDLSYTINNPTTPVVSSLTPDTPGHIEKNGTVNWTAAAYGGPDIMYEYQFSLDGVAKGWYTGGNTWAMNTASIPAGSHNVMVQVRTSGTTPTTPGSKTVSYKVDPVIAPNLTAAPAASCNAGATATFTASATGGSGVTVSGTMYQYQFVLDGNTTTPVQTWSAAKTWAWTPGNADVSNTPHTVTVYIANADGTGTVQFKTISYTVKTAPTLAVSGLSFSSSLTSKTGHSPVGDTITWNATPVGGTGSYAYQFERMGPDTGGAYKVEQTWNSSPSYSWSWNPTALSAVGANTIQVRVVSLNGTTPTGTPVTKTVAYKINAPLTVTSLKPAQVSPQYLGATPLTITWTAQTAGGTGQTKYRFSRLGPDTKGVYSAPTAWASSPTYVWKPDITMAGINYMKVEAMNSDGTEYSFLASGAYNVIAKLTIISLSPNGVGVTDGSPVTLTALVGGGTGNYQYKFQRGGPDTYSGGIDMLETLSSGTDGWSTSNTATWNVPSGGPVNEDGLNYVYVWVRATDGSGTPTTDAPVFLMSAPYLVMPLAH